MSEKMSSCPLPFRKKWRERCATPVLKVAVATWTLEIEKQLRVFICVVLQPWAVRKKIKSQVQFCSTLSSPNCPIPLVVYFLVCGVDLVGNCQAKGNCHLAVLPYPCSFPVSAARQGHLCSSWTPWAAHHTLCHFTLWLWKKCSSPLPSLCWHSSLSRPVSYDDSISSTTGW